MNERIYISDGKKFVWKAQVTSHLIEEEDKCPKCGGNGHRSRFDMMWDNDTSDGRCDECNGTGKKCWHGPMFFDNECQGHLQKCLNKYIEDKITFAKNNPPYIGMDI